MEEEKGNRIGFLVSVRDGRCTGGTHEKKRRTLLTFVALTFLLLDAIHRRFTYDFILYRRARARAHDVFFSVTTLWLPLYSTLIYIYILCGFNTAIVFQTYSVRRTQLRAARARNRQIPTESEVERESKRQTVVHLHTYIANIQVE